MFKLINTSFTILKNNFIFIQPLLIYMIFSMYITEALILSQCVIYVKGLLLLSLFLMLCAFLSGWLHINLQAVNSYNDNDSEEEIHKKMLSNFKTFFFGVGENYLKTLLGLLIYFIFYCLAIVLIIKLSISSDMAAELFQKISQASKTSNQALLVQIIQENASFILLMIFSSLIFDFIGLLYFVILFKTGKNPIISIFKTIKFFFSNFFNCIYIMIILFLIYMIIGALSAVFGSNSLSYIIMTILISTYLNYSVLLVFCLYNEKTNSDNRSEFIG